jgi:hypothetical protein
LTDLFEDEELSVGAIKTIRTGDVEALRSLLSGNPGLATATITRRERGNRQSYSYPLIGAATDWPGHFPNVAESIRVLVAAGADVNARAAGPHRATPLHGSPRKPTSSAFQAVRLGSNLGPKT